MVWHPQVTVKPITGLTAQRAGFAAKQYLESVQKELGDEGVGIIVIELKRVIRRPTPIYWTKIRAHRNSQQQTVIDDDHMIYGPWLEGTGSRNYPVTRFKGYSVFRRSQQRIQRQANKIAKDKMPVYRRGIRR